MEPSNSALHARTWDEFVGQTTIKQQLDIRIRAAVEQNRLLDHVLLTGPPGFGKTTLSNIIASQLGCHPVELGRVQEDGFLSLTMPVKFTALAHELRVFQGGVILLDEIHRCPEALQNDLLTLLAVDPKEGYLQLPNGRRQETAATIIGATTEPEKLIPPLYDRFGFKPFFEAYTDEEMGQIVLGMCFRLGVDTNVVPDEMCVELGRAAGGVPRNAGMLVRAARDLDAAFEDVTLDAILAMAGVDATGLDRYQIEILRTLDILGGTAGLQTLSSLLRLHPSVITDKERLLIKQGLIERGERGRSLTKDGYRKLAESTGESCP